MPDDKLDPALRSPVRPTPPEELQWPRRDSTPPSPIPEQPTDPATSPMAALSNLRAKMERVANEYASGKINRAQFNAMYGRYSEQRAIIERLIERNPNSAAWKQVIGAVGHTGFLRQHFEAQVLYYMIYRHEDFTPLMMGGKVTPSADEIAPVVQKLWSLKDRPKAGLARRAMGENHWLILALGEYTVTLVLFQLEPSVSQANLVRDLHNDFERANNAALARGTTRLDRMVFPQRALVEQRLS